MDHREELSIRIPFSLNSSNEKIYQELLRFSKHSEVDIATLFKQYCFLSSLDGIPRKESLLAYLLRELLDSLYERESSDEEVDIPKQVETGLPLPPVSIKKKYQDKFSVDCSTGEIRWKGKPWDYKQRDYFAGLSPHQGYKCCCYEIFNETRSTRKKGALEKLRRIRERDDPVISFDQHHQILCGKLWELRIYFNGLLHQKKSLKVDQAEWKAKVQETEAVIVAITASQEEIYRRIDSLLSEGMPSRELLSQLKVFVFKNSESHGYFFERISAEWLKTIAEDQDFFTDPPSPKQEGNLISYPLWVESRYLVRIAEEVPEDALTVISNISTREIDNPRIFGDFINAFRKMAGRVELLGEFERAHKESWFFVGGISTIDHDSVRLMNRLIELGQFDEARALFRCLIHVNFREDGGPREVTPLSEHYLSQLVDELENIPADNLEPFLRLLLESHHAVIEGRDLSEIGLRGYDEEKIFFNVIESQIERFFKFKNGSDELSDIAKRLFHELDENDPLIRLRLQLYANFSKEFDSELKQEVLSKRIEDYQCEVEYLECVRRFYSGASGNDKKAYLSLVRKGPTSFTLEKKFLIEWKARRLRPILDLLTDGETEGLTEEVEISKNLPKKAIRHPVVSMWSGPTSEYSLSDLQQKSVPEIIALLKGWTPDGKLFSPSRTGLSRTFGTLVSLEPKKFVDKIELFDPLEIRPVYLYQLIDSVKLAIRNDGFHEAKPILGLIHRIIELAKNDRLEVGGDLETLESDWTGVFQSIAWLFAEAIHKLDLDPMSDECSQCFGSIEFVLAYPDPVRKNESKHLSDGRDPMDLAVNSLRGWAERAHIRFLGWYAENTDPEDRAEFYDRGMEWYRNKLQDPNISIVTACQIGEFVPWIFKLATDIGKLAIKTLFQSRDPRIAWSTWAGYARNSVWAVIHKELESAYEYLLNELWDAVPSFLNEEDCKLTLGRHLLTAYFYSSSDFAEAQKDLLFSKADTSLRRSLISTVGIQYVHEGGKVDTPPRTELLEKFWRDRIEHCRDSKELEEFGWWIRNEIFDVSQTLELLNLTLSQTGGKLDTLYGLAKWFSCNAKAYTEQVLIAVEKLVFGLPPDLCITYFSNGDLNGAIEIGLGSTDQAIRDTAYRVKDRLLKLGLNKYR